MPLVSGSHERLSFSLLAVIAATISSAPLDAQQSAPPSHWEHVQVRSGVHQNPTPVEGVVWRHLVTTPAGTPWLRLYYSNVFLDKGSYLRIVSLLDGDFMTQRQEHIAQWDSSSCFFNGNAVMIELVAGPNTQKNFVEIDKVMAGDINPVTPLPETICGTTDDRSPSSDARTGRIDPIGCTGWIIDMPGSGLDKCHLSAGHCRATGQVLEFAVPASGANCALAHPPAAKQFAINTATSQFVNGGVGNDYWVFRCFANSTTGRTTFEEQGAAWQLSPVIPAATTLLRNFGYGLDGTNVTGAGGGNTPNCFCTPGNGTGTRNQTQQSHTGPLNSATGTALNYGFDTCGGNSGGPVQDAASGLAIGIHTHAGCNATPGTGNNGTQITHAGLQAAIAAVCAGGGHANDECAGAVTVTATTNGPFDNRNASFSAPVFPCGFNVGNDCWFRLSTCAGTYTISTCTTTRNFDTAIEVFSGSCGALTSVGCNDDACSLGSSLTVTLTAGTHLIRVGGYNGQAGDFDLVISSPCHGNDDCTGALPLANGVNGPFDNNTASTSLPAWPCGGGGNDCWFSYVVPCSNLNVTFATCETVATYDTTIEVFSGSCGNLTSLACNDDACGPTFRQSSVTVSPPVGTLFVRVGGFFGARGAFNVTVTPVPTDDECSSAITVNNGTNGPFCNLGATTSSPWPCGAGGNDVWFTYVATCTGELVATTCTAARTFDTTLQIFDGSCTGLNSLGCNDDTGGGCGLGSTLRVPVQVGQTYFIRMGGFGSAQGVSELVLDCIHPTDECDRAAAVVDGVNGPFSTQFATTSAPGWPCGAGGNDCWFAYTASCTAPHTFTTCTPTRSFDTVIEVFDGGCPALNSLGCNDDGCDGLGSRLVVNLTSGTTYQIRVGGFGGARGSFDLTIEAGTGTGSITRNGPGCGSTTIAVTGQPRIGGVINIALSGVVGAPFIGLGFAVANTPFCGVCTFGHEWAFANFGATQTIVWPCNPLFIGTTFGAQGADLLAPGGCPAPQLRLTDTFRIVIG
ncbi:MAG: hypothetical protein IPK26_03815 [Planctomycetes bacterium]|nr:hypothetical protein [Planctomycetota bacterium]